MSKITQHGKIEVNKQGRSDTASRATLRSKAHWNGVVERQYDDTLLIEGQYGN